LTLNIVHILGRIDIILILEIKIVQIGYKFILLFYYAKK